MHHLDETKHFIRSFVGIVYFIFKHFVFGSEIRAPKLIDLKTALVYIEMDITLLEIRCASFPNHRLGMQNLNRLPRAVADTFAMCFG